MVNFQQQQLKNTTPNEMPRGTGIASQHVNEGLFVPGCQVRSHLTDQVSGESYGWIICKLIGLPLVSKC